MEWIAEHVQFCGTVDTIEYYNSTEVAVVAVMVIRMLPLFPHLRSFRCAHLVLHSHNFKHAISGKTDLLSFHTTNYHISDLLGDYLFSPFAPLLHS